jgi:hypothetical protein
MDMHGTRKQTCAQLRAKNQKRINVLRSAVAKLKVQRRHAHERVKKAALDRQIARARKEILRRTSCP